MPDPVTLPTPILKPVKVPDPPSKPAPIKLPRTSTKSLPEAILVSGTAFPRDVGEKMRDIFSHYCDRMAVRLNDKYPGLKITVFNFHEGNQQLYEFSGTTLKKTVVQTWDKFNLKNYRYAIRGGPSAGFGVLSIHKKRPSPEAEYLYLVGLSESTLAADAKVSPVDYESFLYSGTLKEKSLSMGDVYEYINNVGRAWDEGTSDVRIVEMHIFSRGGARFGEPKLINSHHDINDGEKIYNKDGHIDDFDSEETEYFKSAFAYPHGFMVHWGSCNDRELLQLIRNVMRDDLYLEGLKNPGDDIFLYEPLGFYMSLQWVNQHVRDQYLELNYMKNFTERALRKGYTAPPGVDVNLDNERTQTKFGMPLMHVFMGKEFRDPPELDYKDVLKFYKELMGFHFWDTGEYHITIYGRGYMAI